MSEMRIECDSMGELEVPANALYRSQTQRAINNFAISGQTLPREFILALLEVKIAAAQANLGLNCLPPEIANAIIVAAKNLRQDDNLMQHFPVDVFQTGSGTSTNMNANEVIASIASGLGDIEVNPNDHVNFGQSSNDVIPTTIHVSAAIQLQQRLLPALVKLQHTIEEKARQVGHHIKTGRTHLMDAMPVSLEQSLQAWADQIRLNCDNLKALQPTLQTLAQGGTAVGTGINAHPEFSQAFSHTLSQNTGLDFKPADNFFTHIASQDTAVALSGQLKTTAVSLMKIANDLRWMNSGPLAGLGEISLPALQPGSSIMPGKVNPVIPEAVAMVAAQVIGNDAAITIGGQSGNFELNVMLPMIGYNLLNSIKWLSSACDHLGEKAIADFSVNEAKLQEALERNPILVTALNPIIGYTKAASIAKQAYAEERPIVDVAEEQTDLSRDELNAILNPEKLTRGGL